MASYGHKQLTFAAYLAANDLVAPPVQSRPGTWVREHNGQTIICDCPTCSQPATHVSKWMYHNSQNGHEIARAAYHCPEHAEKFRRRNGIDVVGA